MIKSIVKAIVAILIANALWRGASAYISYFRFQDAVTDLAIHSGDRTEEQIKDKVVELAGNYDEPLDADAVTVRRTEQHTYVDGRYVKPVTLLPGYEYQWPFVLKVDGFVILPPRLELANPK